MTPNGKPSFGDRGRIINGSKPIYGAEVPETSGNWRWIVGTLAVVGCIVFAALWAYGLAQDVPVIAESVRKIVG